ncbi:MAG: hypothetical protein M3Y58_21145 [Chloroflexota bacterium]|nr:hypothetical protein [Chloroflexota bacterium]
MAFYAAVVHRGKNYRIGGLIETAFETEEAARSAAAHDVDERDEARIVAVFSSADLQAAKIETIRRGLDWRWQPGQRVWLSGRTLHHHRYRTFGPTWDHDHCYFCWRKFMDPSEPTSKPEWFISGEIATEGYATTAFDERPDDYYWICDDCFHDFDPFFHWEVIEGERREEHE